MNTHFQRRFVSIATAAALTMFVFLSVTKAQTTTFTYQGNLKDNSIAATGTYDFQFALYSAAAGGTQIGATQTQTGVQVTNGSFTVQLDFGAAAFPGADRFLEIRVKPQADATYKALSPR